MCGIAGIVDYAGSADELTRLLATMNHTQRHRGPDEQGLWTSAAMRSGLAMTRLSIVDLTTGSQPLPSEDGRVVLVCNGEIYNHRGLRHDLEQRGHRFRGRSDAEVAVHLYEEKGIDGIEELDGMFALAIIDAGRQQVWLARDRMGMKHLYYAHTKRGFLFASEIRALLSTGLIPADLAAEHLPSFLNTGFIPAPYTALRGIHRLCAGQRLLYAGSRTTLQTYWQPRFHGETPPLSHDDYACRLEELLRKSVAAHLDADVPVGVFLSGGLDSSLVAILAAQASREPLRTFSLTFPGTPSHDESVYSRAVADRIGSRHTEVEVHAGDVWNVLPDTVRSVEDLCTGAPGVLLYQLARTAARDLKAVLGGEGADELFAGYPWMQAGFLDGVRPWFPQWLGFLTRHVSDPTLHQALRVLTDSDRAAAHQAGLGPFPPKLLRQLLQPGLLHGAPPPAAASTPAAAWKSCRDTLEERLCVDMTSRLPDCLMLINDKVTMAHSLELRMPFLDRKLVEFSLGVPSHFKSRRGQEKYILRGLDHLLPSQARGRRKQGLAIPHRAFFLTPSGRALLRDRLLGGSATRSLFQTRNLERWVDRKLSGKLRGAWLLWRLLYLGVWNDEFLQPARRSVNTKS